MGSDPEYRQPEREVEAPGLRYVPPPGRYGESWAATANDPDEVVRSAAFSSLDDLRRASGDILPWSRIARGFEVNGRQIFFATQAEGIFKPQQMRTVLSIKTSIPRPGRSHWYRDQTVGLLGAEEDIRYDFRREGATHVKNMLLLDAKERRLPLIYFFGIAPAIYHVIAPAFVTDWRPQDGLITVTTSVRELHPSPLSPPLSSDERRYATRAVKQRLHQSMFRERVIAAYRGRCAITRLPLPGLVEAAHVVPDIDTDLGQPNIQNGICLSKLHHAAFDQALIGIDPDFRVHVSRSVLEYRDGPMLEQLKTLNGASLQLPRQRECWPDRDRLAVRFERFVTTA